jgi:H+/Cl- antiporter ClcA
MYSSPDFKQIRKVIGLRLWRDRAVIWIGAIVTGLFIVAFVWMTDAANKSFASLRTAWPWLPLVITPLGGITVVWLTRRLVGGAAGSGIPQVIAALNADVSSDKSHALVSLRISFAKALLGATAIAAGFSAGREGPSVQIAAGVMRSCHRFIIHKPLIREKDLILAGGAAGIAAAFNAPLAGVVFAIEELSKRFEERSSGVLITAIVIAGLVAVSLMGNLNYFGRVQESAAPLEIIGAGILVAVLAGVIGGLFSRLLIHSFRNKSWRFNQWRSRYPLRFAAGCGFAVAVLGLVSGGAAFGSGYAASQSLLSGQEDISIYYFVVKFLATWISFWSGIPGGIFAPSLAIGAGLGHDVALLTAATSAPTVIALGMAGFLAAVTQAPITSFIIVMEMTDGHSMVLSLMAASLLSSMISRLISAPLYPTLAGLQIAQIEASTLSKK